jgi:hypothetical protein
VTRTRAHRVARRRSCARYRRSIARPTVLSTRATAASVARAGSRVAVAACLSRWWRVLVLPSANLGYESRERRRECVEEVAAGDRLAGAFGDHRLEHLIDVVGSGAMETDHELVAADCSHRCVERVDLPAEAPVVGDHEVRSDGKPSGGDVSVLGVDTVDSGRRVASGLV